MKAVRAYAVADQVNGTLIGADFYLLSTHPDTLISVAERRNCKIIEVELREIRKEPVKPKKVRPTLTKNQRRRG